MSFSLQAAFNIMQKPFSLLVIIRSSITPPLSFSKNEYFDWFSLSPLRSVGIIFSNASSIFFPLI